MFRVIVTGDLNVLSLRVLVELLLELLAQNFPVDLEMLVHSVWAQSRMDQKENHIENIGD